MPDTVEAQPQLTDEGPSWDTSQLDAVLNSALPDAPASPTEPGTTAVAAPEPAKPAHVAPTPTPATPVDDPLTPPPAVGGDAKPADAVPTEEEKFPETPEGGFKSKKQENDWRKWGEKYEKQAHELKQLRTAAQKAPEPDQAAIEKIKELETRNVELMRHVERYGLENSEPFQRQFAKPIEGLKAKAIEAAKAGGIDVAALSRALSMKGEERIAALGELTKDIENPLVVRRLDRIFDDLDTKESDRDAVLADVQGNAAKMQQQERQQRFEQAQQQEKNLNATVEQLTDYLAKNGYEFFGKTNQPGYEKWNTRIDNDIAELKHLAIKNQDPNKLLMALALGTQAPHYKAAWEKRGTMIAERDAEIARLKGTLPNLDGSPPKPAGANGKDDIDPNEDLVATAHRLLREMNPSG